MWALLVPLPMAMGVRADDGDAGESPKSDQAKAEDAVKSGFVRDVDWVGLAEGVRDQAAEKKPGGTGKRRQPWFMDDELLARAGVSTDTAAAIRQSITDSQAEFKTRQQESGTGAAAAMRELFRVLQSDEFDEARAGELLDQVLEQRSELIRAQLEPKIRVRALLSASQIAALRAERPRFFMEPLQLPQTGPKGATEEPQAEAAVKD